MLQWTPLLWLVRIVAFLVGLLVIAGIVRFLVLLLRKSPIAVGDFGLDKVTLRLFGQELAFQKHQAETRDQQMLALHRRLDVLEASLAEITELLGGGEDDEESWKHGG